MPDLSSVAREAAERYVGVMDDPGELWVSGFTECASRIPSEEELAEAMFDAYCPEIAGTFADELPGTRMYYIEHARAARALIEEKISG